MIRKYAALEIISAEYGDQPNRRVAHRADFTYSPRPGYLYVRSRAISSRTNDNYDDFPADEIKKGYLSFIGKPVFVNHVNEDHKRARGVVIDAALHHDVNPNGSPDTWCEVLMEVDAIRFPKLAKAIVLGHIDRTSMGVDVEYSICSACGNKATSPAEYCRHIPQLKGSKIVRRNASTGRPEETLIYETCFGLSFFENSLLVEDPADPTALVLGVQSGDVRPKFASKDLRDVVLTDAEHLGDVNLSQLAMFVQAHLPDTSDIILSENGSTVTGAVSLPVALDHVSHVVPVGAKDPVRRVLATPNVAGVTDYQAVRNRTDQLDVGPAMSPDGSRTQLQGELGITTGKAGAKPGPAGLGATGAIDLGQVPLQRIHGDHSKRSQEGLGAFVAMEAGVFWHGSPSGDLRGSFNGLHVGTEEAARQALHARIGEPAEGKWDGTREYGKTLLKGRSEDLRSGYNMEDRPDHFPQPATYHLPVREPGVGWRHGPAVAFEDREPGKHYNSVGAVYGDQSPVPMDAKPDIFPVRIKGPMTNTPQTPHEDFKANGLMAGQIKRGRARSGYYYRQVGEDPGSISAVVPNGDHLERLGTRKQARYEPEHDASEEGEMEMEPDPSGFFPGGIATRWHQNHHVLVQNALHHWKGDPINALTHWHHEINDDPQPDSGSGKRMRAESGALRWELQNNSRTFGRKLYRGVNTAEDRVPQVGDVIDHDARPRGYSSNQATARRFAGKPDRDYGRRRTVPVVYETAPGTKGLRIKDYGTGSGLDQSEQEYVLHGQHQVTHVEPTERGFHVRTRLLEPQSKQGLLGFVAALRNDDDLTAKAPGEIDQSLSDHWDNLYTHQGRQQSAMDSMHYAVGDKQTYITKTRKKWNKSHEEVLNHDTTGMRPWDAQQYESSKSKHAEASQNIADTHTEISRHNAEFDRRGGWSRFFLVPDGHIHSSMQCHSCRPTTRFGWLPHLSGKGESEAVEQHGPHLCTHCFASAPVEWKRDPTETRAEEKRKSGDICPGGKASKFLGRDEIDQRKATHPQNKIRLDPGEAFYAGGRQGQIGKCPTCNTVQKVKNDGNFYNHKPPPVVMTPPREAGLHAFVAAFPFESGLVRFAARGDDPGLDEALDQLGEILSRPSPRRDANAPMLPAAHEMYGGLIQEHPSGHLHVSDEEGTRPLEKLYRVVHPKEWEQAQSQGYLQSHPPGHAPYTRASAQPDERWRFQSADQLEAGTKGHTLEIDYHPDDKWHASAEGYAATRAKIPLHRVRKIGVAAADPYGKDLPEGSTLYHVTSDFRVPDIKAGGFQPSHQGESGAGLYTHTDEAAADKMATWQDFKQKATLRTNKPLHLFDRDAPGGEQEWRRMELEHGRAGLTDALGQRGYHGVSYGGVGGRSPETVIHDPARHLEVTDWGQSARHTGLLSFVADLGADEDLWKHPMPDWDNDEYERRGSEYADENLEHGRRWKSSMRRALSLGHLTHGEARQRDYYASGHDSDQDGRTDRHGNHWGWQPMPHDLYHVTTNAPAVHEHGLKSRDELNQSRGLGLGGGESDTISFTTDRKMAEDIHHGLHEMRQAASGERTVHDMRHEAENGIGANRPFWHNMMQQYHNGWKHGDPLPMGLDSVMRGKKLKAAEVMKGTAPDEEHEWTPHPRSNHWTDGAGQERYTHWERDATPAEKSEEAINLHKNFAYNREYAGGRSDPMFFTSDADALGKIPPHHIQIMKFHPKPGAQGYPVTGMKEWRTATGDAVEHADEDQEERHVAHLRAFVGSCPFESGLQSFVAAGGRSDVPEVLWHYSPEDNHESIMRRGLLPRHPDDDSSLAERDNSPAGVYLFKDRRQAELDEGNVYQVHTTGLANRFHADPQNPASGYYTPDPIPPSHITHDGPTPDLGGKRTAAKTEVSVAGLAVVARDTGRVLMLQRSNHDDKDPAAGTWEFPGGHLDEGESPAEGAIREWKEELGCPLPPGQFGKSWLSKGMYQGHVYVIDHEDDVDINCSGDDRKVLNPDDPDGDEAEVAAWFDPKDLPKMPALRDEVRTGTDWSVFSPKAIEKVSARQTQVPLQHILDNVKPTDDPSWSSTFKYIEQNHASQAPEHWGKFLDHVRSHGIQTPVVILHKGEQQTLFSGHHRVWAAHKLGLTHLPALETHSRAEGHRLSVQQGDEESAWQHQAGLRAFIALDETGDPPVAHVPTALMPWNGNMVHQPVSAAWSAMGAPMDDKPEELHPERYEPNKGFGVHLKNGEIETKTGGSDANGVATQHDVTPVSWADRDQHEIEKGMPMAHSDGVHRINAKVPGSERPLDHVYRIMHEDEYQQAKQRGYFKSDERMNLSSDEGTVASEGSTGSFYSTPGPNRIVRLRHHPEDGWKRDSDSYIKTQQKVPFHRADLISPIIHNHQEIHGDPKRSHTIIDNFHIEGLEHEAPHLQAQAGLRAFVADLPVDTEAWKQDKPAEIDYDKHKELWDSGRKDEASAMWDTQRAKQKNWDASMRRAISVGHIQPEEAMARGHKPDGYEQDYGERDFRDPENHPEGRQIRGWMKMPDTMWHVTTNAPAVQREGLKTRYELDQQRGVGLGGGDSGTVSTTTDEGVAHDVHRGLHEMRQVARGERTIPHMVEEAKNGTDAERPFWKDIIRHHQGYVVGNDKPETPHHLDMLMRGMRGPGAEHSQVDPTRPEEPGDWRPHPEAKVWQHGGTGETLASRWERPATHDEKIEDAVEFHKTFAYLRSHAGGPSDPLFSSSDPHSLAKIPAHHIQILKVHPKPGAKGYPMSAMKEWRTSSGDALSVDPEPVTPKTHFARLAQQEERLFDPGTLHDPHEGHLANPLGGYDWHHGSPHDFHHFDEDREYGDEWDETPEHNPHHWNTHLGTHWTSIERTAEKFAKGKYSNYDEGPGHVFTANLGIKNPKHYDHERDMDTEAFNHAWDGHDPENIHAQVCKTCTPQEKGEGDFDEDPYEHHWAYGRPATEHLEHHTLGDEVDNQIKQHYYEQGGGNGDGWLSDHPDASSNAEEFKQHLKSQGHDGVTYGNGNATEGPIGHPCAITFENHQIHNLRRRALDKQAGLDGFVAVYDEEGRGHNEGPSPYEADERDEEGFNPDGKCPYCTADKNHEWNTEHNDGHEMPYSRENMLWRGFHIPTDSHPDLSSGDPEKMAKAVMSRSNVGVHWSRDFHRAQKTFALPPRGHVGVLMGMQDWHCKDRAPVDPGYSHENEVRFKEGTPIKLHRLDLYPDRDQISHQDREKNWRKWQDLERHVKGRQLTAAYDDEDNDTSGDGYVHMPDGSTRWGLHGAAGILLHHHDQTDGQHYYLLQHRSGGVQEGNTWSTPGGALNRDEDPFEGAKREMAEENGIELPEGHKLLHTHHDDQGPWAYHTSLVDVPHRPQPQSHNWESSGMQWFTPDDMKGLDLHPGFEKSLPHLLKKTSGLDSFVADFVPHTPGLVGQTPVNMDVRQPSGSPVRGRVIHPDDPSIPDVLHHVTTNLSAVKESGHLKAGGVGGLGGDEKDQIVSMTTDRGTANQLAHDIGFMAHMHRKHGEGPERKTPEHAAWGRKVVDDFHQEGLQHPGLDFKEAAPHQLSNYTLRDWATHYYVQRSSHAKIKNPLFFGDLSHVDPKNVGVVHIPKHNLKESGSMITDFDRDNPYGLNEIRAYGDVPLHGAWYESKSHHQASYHDTGQWEEPPRTLPNGDSVSGYGDAVPGGYNESLRAFHPDTGEETGRLDVNTARHDPSHLVAWMHTPEEHRGRGTMVHLLEHYRQHLMEPGAHLDFGMTTPEGQAWIDKHQSKTAADDEEWRGQHQPSMGPPIHNLLEKDEDGGQLAPDDIYTHMHYYTDGEANWDSESHSAIQAARHDRPLHQRPAKDNSRFREMGMDFEDHPPESDEAFARRKQRRADGEHHVTIYRAAPKGLKNIGTGDWVTPSASYARDHARHPTDSKKDWPVYKARVPAKHVRWAGDSLNEFGYNGPPIKAYYHTRGGTQSERLAAFVVGMAWQEHGLGGMSEEEAGARPVKKAGFKGYVGTSDWDDPEMGGHFPEMFHEKLWENTHPEPTHEEQAHYEEHDEYPESYDERHDQAYTDAVEQKGEEERPDHIDDHLHHWVQEHSTDANEWRKHAKQPQQVDLRKGVYATQSHVGQFHIDRYLHGGTDEPSWHSQSGGHTGDYLGESHPLFVTHQGRLHAIEGHHRVAAALQRGDSHIEGWHHDLDRHPIAEAYQGGPCEECEHWHEDESHLGHLAAKSPQTYFHGTTVDLKPGDLIHPANQIGQTRNYPGLQRWRAEHVWATPDEAGAWGYSEHSERNRGTHHQYSQSGVGDQPRPRVYEVEPMGPVHKRRRLSTSDPEEYTMPAARVLRSIDIPHPDVPTSSQGRYGEEGIQGRLPGDKSWANWKTLEPDAKDLSEHWELSQRRHPEAWAAGDKPEPEPEPSEHPGQGRFFASLQACLQALGARPDIGKGWWLTPEGKKISVYDHYETTPGMARQMIRPHMADSGQVRVRSYNNQLNVQTSRPFTDKQRQSLLMDADKHSRMFVDVLHPDTEESIHSESGGPEDADRMLARAHSAAIPHTASLTLLADQPYAGGYQFTFRQARPNTTEAQADKTLNYHRLDAFHENTQDLTQGRGGHAGFLLWHHKTGEIGSIETLAEHQRKGLATEMLSQARQIAAGTRGVKPPRHSAERTNAGEAWARSTGDRLPRRVQSLAAFVNA